MPGNTRQSDIWVGICLCHTPPIPMAGPVISYSSNVKVNNRGQARHFDRTMGYCGHTGKIAMSSKTVKVNGRGVVRQGDYVTGCNVGTIQSSSQNAKTNG